MKLKALKINLFFVCLLNFSLFQLNASPIFNVKDFGASGIKSENATEYIQRALDACYENGGGVVVFPAGEYLASTLVIKDNTTIELNAGASIIASNNPSDYKSFVRFEDTGGGDIPVLLYAEKAKNIKISGEGKLIGQPEYYFETLKFSSFIEEDYHAAKEAGVDMNISRWKYPNVSLVVFSECEQVILENFSVIDSPFWGVHLHWCNDVQIRGLKISSKLNLAANSDGLDIDGCKNVTISDCIIETGDDAICLKTTKSNKGTRDCENIVVTNCVLSSSSCALKLGTESYGNFNQIIFSNCTIYNTNRGLGIFIRDGGIASNIIFTNIIMTCNRKPVGWWGSADAFRFVVLKRNENSKIGRIENIFINNVIANVQGTSIIAGFENTETIKNVTLKDINLTILPELVPDKRAKEGILIKNGSSITLENVKIDWQNCNSIKTKWTNSLRFETIDNLKLKDISISNQPKGYKLYQFSNIKNLVRNK